MSYDLDPVWKALADPTRRTILDLLRRKPMTTNEIVERVPDLSRFGVMKHLAVLREAGLVQAREEGRSVVNSLNVVPIRRAVRALGERLPGSVGAQADPAQAVAGWGVSGHEIRNHERVTDDLETWVFCRPNEPSDRKER